MMRKSSFILLLLIALVTPSLASAQGPGLCPPIPTDESGVPDFQRLNLRYAGEYTHWLVGPWTIPGTGIQTGFGLHFTEHVDDEGRHWLMPSLFTTMYIAITGWEPDFPNTPMAASINPAGVTALLDGHYEELNITPEGAGQALGRPVESLEMLNPDEMMQVLRWYGRNVRFWFDLNRYLAGLALEGTAPYGFTFTYYVYCGDPMTPQAGTGGSKRVSLERTTPVPRPTPVLPPSTPAPEKCGHEEWERTGKLQVTARYEPSHPVVAGQDREKAGVVIYVHVVAPPILHRFGVLKGGKCRAAREYLPDPVESVAVVRMALSPESIAWIEGELAQRYPGARVKKAELEPLACPVYARRPTPGGGEEAWAACRYEGDRAPLDPGYWHARVEVQTGGHPPQVAGASARVEVEIPVYLLDSTIIR